MEENAKTVKKWCFLMFGDGFKQPHTDPIICILNVRNLRNVFSSSCQLIDSKKTKKDRVFDAQLSFDGAKKMLKIAKTWHFCCLGTIFGSRISDNLHF